ncbi:hypothetical protein [Sphingomonas qomolangmaensis]|uniref:Uncharacterized protein n=1 Tax=Sphingomonas qomolangmaensis TaxID=2918765 RepID=A0ABY5LAV7_9SPHN|nr:hypothetical protein [Sphingomonas qomolangmaensis]UUL83271.1 hypothetical protein NMP03_03295 [Sphingomonas qomolangmaensis]
MTDDPASTSNTPIPSRPTATAIGDGPGYSGQDHGTADQSDPDRARKPALAADEQATRGAVASAVDLRGLPADAGYRGAPQQGTGEVHGSGAGAGGGNPGEDYDSDTGGDQSEDQGVPPSI